MISTSLLTTLTLARRIAILTLVAFTTASCSYDELADRLIPKEESRYAQDFLERLRIQDFDYVKSQLDRSMIDKIDDEKLVEIASFFPAGEQLSVEIVGSHVNKVNSDWYGNFTFEYEFEGGWALASIAMKRIGDETTVIGFSVYQTPASQRDLTAFSAVEITPVRVIVLLLTVAIPIFMIFTCVMVYRTRIPAKKRWYLFSFFGLFDFSLNWTSGVLSYQLLKVQLIGFGFSAAGPAAPFLLTFTLPIGAIVFWAKRKELIRRAESEAMDENEQEIKEPD